MAKKAAGKDTRPGAGQRARQAAAKPGTKPAAGPFDKDTVARGSDASVADARPGAGQPLEQVNQQPGMTPATPIAGTVIDAGMVPPARKAVDPKKRIKVRAIRLGYYDDKLQRIGDVFTIADETHFSKNWMERVAANTPEHTTGSNAALRRGDADQVPLGGGDDSDVI